MSKNLDLVILLDFYGDMLTDKQKEVVELYYNEDLSLGEIAQHFHITRQGVRDSIKRAEAILIQFEERLGLVERFKSMQEGLETIIACAKEISFESEQLSYAQNITKNARRIAKIAAELNE